MREWIAGGIPGASREQEARIVALNDGYGVARYEMEGATMRVWCDDGDEAEVSRDGSFVWKSVG